MAGRSARAALEAKLAVLGDSSSGDGALSPAQAAQLAGHPSWQRSGFDDLERFIFTFLTGGAEAGGGNGAAAGRAGAESVRLKLEVRLGCGPGWLRCLVPAGAWLLGWRLHSCPRHGCRWRAAPTPRCPSPPCPCLPSPQSPLFVADALLGAAEAQLGQELEVARADAASVRLVRSQLAAFRRDMQKEGQMQVGGARWGFGWAEGAGGSEQGRGTCAWMAIRQGRSTEGLF